MHRFIKLPIVHWTVPYEGEAQVVPLVSWLPYQVEASNISYRSKGVFENFRINDLVENENVMNYLLTFQNWLALFFYGHSIRIPHKLKFPKLFNAVAMDMNYNGAGRPCSRMSLKLPPINRQRPQGQPNDKVVITDKVGRKMAEAVSFEILSFNWPENIS